jgi:hypothetical protein
MDFKKTIAPFGGSPIGRQGGLVIVEVQWMAHWLWTTGVILLSVGGSMLIPSIILQKRFGHLVAPRPVMLIVLFSFMAVGGLAIVIWLDE